MIYIFLFFRGRATWVSHLPWGEWKMQIRVRPGRAKKLRSVTMQGTNLLCLIGRHSFALSKL